MKQKSIQTTSKCWTSENDRENRPRDSAVFGDNGLYPPTNSDNSMLYSHELHHLWQSRAMGNNFLTNYVAHGLTSLIGRGNFIETMNFYEQIGYFHHWYE